MYQILMILLSVGLGAVGQITLKYGAMKTNVSQAIGIMKYVNVPIISGLFFYALSALLWIVVLKKTELSYAYPMVSLGYVLVLGASYFIFKENINSMRLIGLVLIVAGIIFISRS